MNNTSRWLWLPKRFTALIALSMIANAPLRAEVAPASGPAARQESSELASPSFEQGAIGEAPEGWSVPPVPGFKVAISDEQPTDGNQCVTVLRTGDPEAGPFGNLLQRIDAADLRGKRVRFKAAVRADVKGRRNQAQLWLRVDRVTPEGDRALGAFDNMGNRPITSADWRHYEIVADVAEDANQITLGFMFLGTGQAWIDDASLEIVDLNVPLTAKSPTGSGRSGKPLDEIKPGLFEVVGSMRLMSAPSVTAKVLDQLENNDTYHPTQVLIPLPLVYRDQVPLSYELSVRPAGAMEAIEICEDTPLNYVVKGTLADPKSWKQIDIEFKSTVLVGPSDFSGVPDEAPVPEEWPQEARPWLTATWCVNSEDERIAAMAAEIRGKTDDVQEIIRSVQAAAAEAFRSAKGQVTSLTAVEALDKQGSCTSCANLVAALLRASGVPARVLAGYPSWSGPLQTHYIVEAYVPGYGWYPIESTMGQAPWPNTHQIQVAIIPPAHEEESWACARPGIAGGVPYLSLTELPDNQASIVSVGTIDGARGCDHECWTLRTLDGASGDWRDALDAADTRWKEWLKSSHSLDVKGQLRFSNALDDDARTVAALIIGAQ